MGRDANDDARVGRRERAVVAARGPRGVVAVAAENGLCRLLARELHGFLRTGDVLADVHGHRQAATRRTKLCVDIRSE